MYIKIIISSIYSVRDNFSMAENWKFWSNFFMSLASTIYLFIIGIIIDNFLPDGLITFGAYKDRNILIFNSPFHLFGFLLIFIILLNYFLVYRNMDLEKIILKYKKYYNKKIFLIYFLIAWLTPMIWLMVKVATKP